MSAPKQAPVVPPSERKDYTRGLMIVDYKTSYLVVHHLGDGDTLIADRVKTLRTARARAAAIKRMSNEPYAQHAPSFLTVVKNIFS